MLRIKAEKEVYSHSITRSQATERGTNHDVEGRQTTKETEERKTRRYCCGNQNIAIMTQRRADEVEGIQTVATAGAPININFNLCGICMYYYLICITS